MGRGVFENLNFWNSSVLNPNFFFVKSCLFLKTEMGNPSSNFTRSTVKCISIKCYWKRCTFMSYASVIATRCPQKATVWSGTYQKSELIQGNQAPLVSCNRYEVRPYFCQNWTQVVHSVWEKKRETKLFPKRSLNPFFCKEWLVSQNWDRQPAFKFDMDMEVSCIYRMMPRNMHLDVERVHERYLKKRPIEVVRTKKVNSSEEIRRS
jgi:hypothetical protein